MIYEGGYYKVSAGLPFLSVHNVHIAVHLLLPGKILYIAGPILQ